MISHVPMSHVPTSHVPSIYERVVSQKQDWAYYSNETDAIVELAKHVRGIHMCDVTHSYV